MQEQANQQNSLLRTMHIIDQVNIRQMQQPQYLCGLQGVQLISTQNKPRLLPDLAYYKYNFYYL